MSDHNQLDQTTLTADDIVKALLEEHDGDATRALYAHRARTFGAPVSAVSVEVRQRLHALRPRKPVLDQPQQRGMTLELPRGDWAALHDEARAAGVTINVLIARVLRSHVGG